MAKARRVAAVAVVLLIVGLVVHSSITATGEPCAVQPSSDNTGIALGSGYTAMSDAEMDRTVEAIRSSGSHWVRFDIDWSAIESTEGTFDWSGTDRLVDIAKSSGLEILGLITTRLPGQEIRQRRVLTRIPVRPTRTRSVGSRRLPLPATRIPFRHGRSGTSPISKHSSIRRRILSITRSCSPHRA